MKFTHYTVCSLPHSRNVNPSVNVYKYALIAIEFALSTIQIQPRKQQSPNFNRKGLGFGVGWLLRYKN